MPTLHLLVKGKVQGVFYRATAKEVADKMGLKGWVRNTEEGAVEIMVSGTEEAVNEFVAWCRKGPSRAVVEDVMVTPKEETAFESFSIVRK